MKARHFLLVAAIVGLMFFLLFKKSTKKGSQDTDDTEAVEQSVVTAVTEVSPSLGRLNSADATASVTPSASAVAVDDTFSLRFSETLSQMSKCIGLVNMPQPAGKVDPVPDQLVGSIRSSLGEAVVQMDDWSQTEVVEKNGVVKRIRVDFDYPDGVTPMRRLSMFTINSYGAAELVELTDAESNNPNEAYIQSLSEGLQVASEERAGRVYFSQGEELMFTVKNGKLQNFSVTRGNKNFSCSDMDSAETSRCICP
jgi:hypothetical protein